MCVCLAGFIVFIFLFSSSSTADDEFILYYYSCIALQLQL